MSAVGDELLAPLEQARAARLLDPAPLPLETGVQRLPSGVLLVAARTVMPGCSGRMFEWWVRSAPGDREYAWWHPLDHVSSRWEGLSPETHVGSTHVVEERLGGEEVHTLHIHFVPDDGFFGDAAAVARARAAGDVSGLVCGHAAVGAEPPRDAQGRPLGIRMCHVARDTADGMVLRSRFWLGAGLDLPPAQTAALFPPEIGLGLMQHATTEFTYLARILPPLHAAENRDREAVSSVW